MNLISYLTRKDTKEEKKKIERKELEEVIDTIAYKHSIPQGIIYDIVWTWMKYEHKRVYNID